MRVLYVWDGEYPWDVRTEKVCLALVEGGHQVFITARNPRAQPRAEARPEGVVERIPSGPVWIRRWFGFPAFFNPVWLIHLGRVMRRHEIEVIVVRDLPLAPTALMVSSKRVPLILDMAENYPAMIRDIWTDGRQGPLDILVRNPAMVARIERFTVGRMDHILTVVEESKQRLIAMGVPTERISVVSNTPPKARVVGSPVRHSEAPLRLVYLGLMEIHRGVGCALDASEVLMRGNVDFHLDLIGDGRDYDHFRNRATALGLMAEHVTFHGRLSHEKALEQVSCAHVGLIPHKAGDSWNTTIPNKLFDYMAAGLAVISSDAVPAARVVRETRSGLVFRSGDAQHLAEMIRQCLDLPTWERYRHAGQEAIRARYNWERDCMVLRQAVSQTVARGSHS